VFEQEPDQFGPGMVSRWLANKCEKVFSLRWQVKGKASVLGKA
jgi:hypothetical protein